MKRFLDRWVGLMLAVGLLGGYAAAQVVDQGRPGKEGAWPVTIVGGSGGGGGTSAVTVQDAPCASPLDTFFIPSTTDGGTCPPTALSGRRSIVLCNAIKNSALGTPIITVTVDGTSPTTSINSQGQDLNVGDCITYNVPSTTPLHCISDTVDAGVKITECK